MFDSYEFSFNGESSAMYGLMIYDVAGRGQGEVSFGNKASIVETRTTGRVQPLHFGVNYHETPLEFTLVFGAMQELDRFEMEDIARWLTGSNEYRWLSIDQPDMELMQFRCIVTQLTPIFNGWLPFAFEATIRCDCPYAYSYPFYKQYTINGTRSILFRNESSVNEYIRPLLTFSPSSGTTSISIVNKSDNNREFSIKNIPSGSVVEVDNNNGIIQDISPYKRNLYGGFNLNFFRFVHGDNTINVSGSGTLTIEGRFLYNVAG